MEFSHLAVILVVAAFFGILAKKFKQPLLIGYLFAGFLLFKFDVIKDKTLIDNLGKIGITLLLFLVGLEMNLKEIPTVGKTALVTGISQILFTFIVGFILGSITGFSAIQSVYLAIAVSFSSTIIVIKLLSEKNVLGSLHGKIAIGFLLVQDLVAILVLIFLSGLGSGSMNFFGVLLMAIKAIILVGLTYFLSKKILPQLFTKYIDVSSELLFIVSIAWALGVASLVEGVFGFTLEIGGFVAGIALSNLPEHNQIAGRTKPLRDFFLTIFFLSLGSGLVVSELSSVILPSLAYSLLVLVGNPIIVMCVMGYLRFKKRTSFLSSVAVAQISEFSLIVVAMGKSLGHLNDSIVAISVLVAAITMTLSTYLILGSEKIYLKIRKRLGIFERKATIELPIEKLESLSGHIVLVGCYRTGMALLPTIKASKIPFVIVDFNPSVYKKLVARNFPALFGDISDPEMLDTVNFEKARLIISTIENINDNLNILSAVRKNSGRTKPTTVFTSITRSDAIKLYEKGANYVVVPDIVAGDHIRHLLRTYGMGGQNLERLGKKHFDRLIFT